MTYITPVAHMVPLKVPVLFNTLDYTGMFLIAGGAGLVGAVITACMPASIKLQQAGGDLS